MAQGESFGDRMLRGMLLVGLAVACLMVLAPFLGLLAWAMILAIVLAPLCRRLEQLFRGRHGLTLIALGLLLVAAVVWPALHLAGASADGIEWLRGVEPAALQLAPPPEWLAGLPFAGEWLVSRWEWARSDLPAALGGLVPYLRDFAVWLLKFAARAGVARREVILAVVIALLLLHREQQVSAYAQAIGLRVAGADGPKLIDLVVRTVRSVFLGIVGTALVQGLLVVLGLAVAGVPGAAVLGFVAFVAAVAQLPTLLVWAPAAVWLWLGDATVAAVGLTIWGLAVVNTVDNFLKPMIISSGAKLPLLLIFIGVIGGLLQFGILGLFIGPVLLGVGHTLFTKWMDLRAS
jgi:predicted PurR-regulated permease PerM